MLQHKKWFRNNHINIRTYQFSDNPTFEHQQVGTLWKNNYLLSVSLNGDINYIDPRVGGKPSKVVLGHQRGITSLTSTPDKRFFTSSYTGKTCVWEEGAPGATIVPGRGHTTSVVALAASDKKVVSCAMDDTVRYIDLATTTYEYLIK